MVSLGPQNHAKLNSFENDSLF